MGNLLIALDGEGMVSGGLGSVAMARTTAFRLRNLRNERRLCESLKMAVSRGDGSEARRRGSASCAEASMAAGSNTQIVCQIFCGIEIMWSLIWRFSR